LPSATEDRPFVLIANTKMPSQRAQALQVVQSSAAFARAGWASTLLVAARRTVAALPAGVDLFDYYGVPAGARPTLERVACADLIDLVPVKLQYLPARLQELTFARNAAKLVLRRFANALVLARELEVGRFLARAGKRDYFLEIHRVPGGALRRRWLVEAARGGLGTIAISAGVQADLVALGIDARTILVEHDALEPRRFASMPTREAARKQLDIAVGEPVVVYTGGMMEWKGVEILLEAARQLPKLRFVIAGGTDADVARLRERARDQQNVRIDGFQAPERVPLYLAAADIGVVPNRSQPAISSRYTSPLKVFESFAAGLPLVASDLPSLRELLKDGQDALLVAPDDAAALARGLARLSSDAALRATFRARALARAPGCTWDARARRILAWAERRIGEARS
jgi:glycosyltransferase involved in cell wall biosynthesis